MSFSRLECGVHDRLHIYPLCGIFYFPCRHQIEGTNGFYCLIRKTERFTISNVESQVFTPNNSRLDPGSNPGCPRDKSYHWTNCTIRCRPVVMSKNRPDVSKMTHGFFITINGLVMRVPALIQPVVMSKNRPDVSKMTHGFFITINGDTGSCINSTRGPTGFFSATHGNRHASPQSIAALCQINNYIRMA